jgi:hypothetical protein
MPFSMGEGLIVCAYFGIYPGQKHPPIVHGPSERGSSRFTGLRAAQALHSFRARNLHQNHPGDHDFSLFYFHSNCVTGYRGKDIHRLAGADERKNHFPFFNPVSCLETDAFNRASKGRYDVIL